MTSRAISMDLKSGPTSRALSSGDRPAVGFNQVAGNGQPNPGSTVISGKSLVVLQSPLEFSSNCLP